VSYLGVELELDALFGHDTLELFAEKEKRMLLYVRLNHKTGFYFYVYGSLPYGTYLMSASMPMPPTWPRNSTAVTWKTQY
jgi:hypothetical protein